MALIPFMLIHLVLAALLGHSELTAAEVLARTRGSAAWLSFYGVFLLLIAIHAPIGVWQILRPLDCVSIWGKLVLVIGLIAVIVGFGAQALFGLYH